MRTLTLLTVSVIAVLGTAATAKVNHDASQSVGAASSLAAGDLARGDSARGDSEIGEPRPDVASVPGEGPRPDFNFPCCPQLNPWENFHQEKRCLSAEPCDKCNDGGFAWLFSFKSIKRPSPLCLTGEGGWLGFHFDLFSLFSLNSYDDGRVEDSTDSGENADPLQEQPNGRRPAADTSTPLRQLPDYDTPGPLIEEPAPERETIETLAPKKNEAPILVRPTPDNPIPAPPRGPAPLLPGNPTPLPHNPAPVLPSNPVPLLPSNPVPLLPADPSPLQLPRNLLPRPVPKKEPQAETPPVDVSGRRIDLYELLLKLR